MSDALPTPKVSKLKEKLGPLPVWTWGLLVGFTVIVAYVLRSKSTNTDNTTGTSAGSVASALDPTGDNYSTDGLTNGVNNAPSVNAAQSGDNTSWIAQAEGNVANKTGASPTLITGALQKFINGDPLTQAEQKWVDTAIQLTGQPPEGVNGISTVTLPPTGAATSGTGTTVKPKPPVVTKPAPVTKLDKYETEADRLFLGLLGRHIDHVATNTATTMLRRGSTTAQVTQWIKNSTEYKKKHPKG